MSPSAALDRPAAHLRAIGRLCAVMIWTAWCLVRRSTSCPDWATRWAQGACVCLGIQVDTQGPIPGPGALVVANHLGYVDILALLSRCPLTFVAKSEIAAWPIAGRLGSQAGLIFINRKRLRDVHRVKLAMQAALDAGRSVAYFPEATSSDGRGVLPFRTGLFEVAIASGRPVTTAAISGWAEGAPADERVCWHGDAELLPHLYRLATTRRHGVTIRFETVGHNLPERKTLASTARATIVATRPTSPVPCYHPRLPWFKGGLRWSR